MFTRLELSEDIVLHGVLKIEPSAIFLLDKSDFSAVLRQFSLSSVPAVAMPPMTSLSSRDCNVSDVIA